MKIPFKKKDDSEKKSMSKKKKIIITGIVVGIITIVLFKFFSYSFTDEFKEDNMTTKTVYGLECKIPDGWKDVNKNDDSDTISYYLENDDLHAGILINHIGSDIEVVGDENEISDEIIESYYISSNSKDRSEFQDLDYKFEGVDTQRVFSYSDTENDLKWNNYCAIVTVDKEAFKIWLYVEDNIQSKEGVEKFFDGINFKEYESPKVLEEIEANYYGSTIEGTTIDGYNDDIAVTAYYNDGTEEDVDDWIIDNSAVLEFGKTYSFKIEYSGKECELKIKCTEKKKTEEEIESEYKQSCIFAGYDTWIHNPEEYANKRIKVNCKIAQVLGDNEYLASFGSNLIHINIQSENIGSLYEGDLVTFYGSGSTSNYNYTTVLGVNKTIPSMDVYYMN
ncbi:MAG: hypothetical protein ACI4E3_09220 [Candidatus Fimousia sp.]